MPTYTYTTHESETGGCFVIHTSRPITNDMQREIERIICSASSVGCHNLVYREKDMNNATVD